MNPSKLDRWPPFERARFVLVQRQYRYERPWQGFVLRWDQRGVRWWAEVVYVDDRVPVWPPPVEWFPADRLRPIVADPNPPRDEWF